MPITSQNPVITYTANGSVTTFSFPFRVIKQSDLHVYKDGVEVVGGFTVSGIDNPAGGSITFSIAPINGTLVRLQRVTSLDRSTDYVEGGQLAASTLDNDFDRVVMMLQDTNGSQLSEVSDGTFDAESKRIKNVANPVNAQDVVTKSYHDSTYIPQINTLITSATTQATNSANSATASANSATLSGTYATDSANSATLSGTYATNSANSATASANSATSAATTLAALSQFTGAAIGGNLSFTGTGQRIVGDFSNALTTNRVFFQTNTPNSSTALGVLPNGTSAISQLQLFSSSDPTNSSYLSINADSGSGAVALVSNKLGTGTYLPVVFITGGAERLHIDTSGNITQSSLNAGTGVTKNITNTSSAANSQAELRVTQGSVATVVNSYANTNSFIGTISNHPVLLITNDTERLRIDTSGTLSMGNAVQQKMNWYQNGNNKYGVAIATGQLQHYAVTGNSITFGHMSSADGTTFTERMRMDAGGNVGIGVTPYSSNGKNLDISDATAARIWLRNTTPTTGKSWYLESGTNGVLGLNEAGFSRFAFDAAGNSLHVTPNGGLGYGTGTGGTVTQGASKVSGVTLNKPNGQITMNAAALASGASVAFQCNNTLVGPYDTVIATLGSVGAVEQYRIQTKALNGMIHFAVTNTSGGSLSEAVVINFAIIKGATA